MFLNDLRNRLQPSAIPMKEHNTQEIEATPSDIIPQYNCQEPLEASYLRGKLFKTEVLQYLFLLLYKLVYNFKFICR